MHNYLKAIGFSNLKTKKDLEPYIKQTIETPDIRNVWEIDEKTSFVEYSKEFADDMGLKVYGEYNEDNIFQLEYYYPYFAGGGITSEEDVTVERHAEKESYAGVCEDVKVGVSLIFYLQNVIEYKNEMRIDMLSRQNTSVTLSALSLSGSVLLPINKTEKQVKITREAMENRNQLIAAARNGDEEAMESLTLEDIDTYTMISRRILKEDVFTLVDTYFMPYGIECDQYSIMGEILDCSVTKNVVTKEEIYILTIESNELIFDVCINKKDLYGEPEKGRRFKGAIWMQGRINFLN